jgi:uncharacterized membrane protein (DUF2068 family)
METDLPAETSTNVQAQPASATTSSSQWSRWVHSDHAGGLLLIGLFKLSKALLSIVLGVGALKLVHHDLAIVVLRVSDVLKIDPESRVVALLMSKADLIGAPQLRHFSALTFTYAAICLVEGTGLMLEKRWAEYFTVSLTILALPWECFELAKEVTAVRVSLLIINLLVLAYLVWFLRRQRRREVSARASEPA